MDKPLTKWYCDVCGEVIEDVKKGYVIWKSTEEMKDYGFKIIHQNKCDPRDNYPLSGALEDFLGEDGISELLSFLSIGPVKKYLGQGSHCSVDDIDGFVDFFRRVQTPFYEEARRYFNKQELLEDYSDANEVYPYHLEQLEKIVKRHGK